MCAKVCFRKQWLTNSFNFIIGPWEAGPYGKLFIKFVCLGWRFAGNGLEVTQNVWMHLIPSWRPSRESHWRQILLLGVSLRRNQCVLSILLITIARKIMLFIRFVYNLSFMATFLRQEWSGLWNNKTVIYSDWRYRFRSETKCFSTEPLGYVRTQQWTCLKQLATRIYQFTTI